MLHHTPLLRQCSIDAMRPSHSSQAPPGGGCSTPLLAPRISLLTLEEDESVEKSTLEPSLATAPVPATLVPEHQLVSSQSYPSSQKHDLPAISIRKQVHYSRYLRWNMKPVQHIPRLVPSGNHRCHLQSGRYKLFYRGCAAFFQPTRTLSAPTRPKPSATCP